MTDEPITRVYGHGGITLTHYPSSGRVAVVQTGTNAVMDTYELYRFMEDAGLLNEIRAEAWDEGRQAEELGWTHAWDGHPVEPDEFCDECKVENPYRKG